MTAYRVKHKTILDFSNQKVNKRSVGLALQKANPLISDESDIPIIFWDNDILVGMYAIQLFAIKHVKKLRANKWKTFSFYIYERTYDGVKALDIKTHPLFKDQYWSSKFWDKGTSAKELTNIILHCNRLNNLRVFS